MYQYAPLAQLAEYRVVAPAVGGSSPLPLPQPQSSQSSLGADALLVSADSFRSLLPSANAPLGHRFLHSPHGTLAQLVESQTENLFAQVRFLEVPLQKRTMRNYIGVWNSSGSFFKVLYFQRFRLIDLAGLLHALM